MAFGYEDRGARTAAEGLGVIEAILGAPVGAFVGLTLVLMGGAALAAGRAVGDGWKPAWQAAAAGLGLALADRFLLFALFEVPLLAPWGFLLHLAILAGLATLSWRVTRVSRMVNQYPWRYERASPFAFREKAGGGAAA